MTETLGPLNLLLLAMPGLALIIVAHTMFRPTRFGQRPEMQQALRMAGAILLLLAGGGVLLCIGGLVALPGLPVSVVIFLMVADRFRRGEHQALLYTLAACAQRGVPLPDAARGFADENGGDASTRALVLAERLEQGLPLRRAVRQARLKLSTASRLAVGLGESLGDLGNVLFQSLDDVAQVDSMLRGMVGRLFYLLSVVFVGAVMLTFVMLKIVPVFAKMFEEFGLMLPAATLLLIDGSKIFITYGYGPLAGLYFFGLLGLLLGTLYYVGWLPSDLPVLNLLTRRYDGALVMRGLALCVRRNLPLPAAFERLADEFPRRSTAGALRGVLVRMDLGLDWRESLWQAGLIGRAEVAVLAAAERAGNLAWALDELAESALRRMVYRIQARYQIIFPLVMLLIGVLVGYVVIALFLPLVSLIQGLT